MNKAESKINTLNPLGVLSYLILLLRKLRRPDNALSAKHIDAGTVIRKRVSAFFVRDMENIS
jgi:hypothetical protein